MGEPLRPSLNQLKRWGKLREGKYRLREQAFLAEGEKVVRELLAAHWPVECLLLREDQQEKWASLDLPCYLLKTREFNQISQDKTPEGIIAVARRRFPAQLDINPQARYLLLYEISNPNNLGAILRTAHWFGLSHVLLSENSVDITHPKAVRSSMGSLFHLHVGEEQNFYSLIKILRSHGIKVIATDPSRGVPPRPVPAGAGILFGNESHGLPDEIRAMCDECWRTPGQLKNGSLSLPQAAAIIIYEMTKEDFL